MAKFDPNESWNRYAQQYSANAQVVNDAVMGQTRTASGGYGNPYAASSAGQAMDNYMSQLYNNYANIYGTTDQNVKQSGQKKNMVNANALWQNYADQYARGGAQASRDTIGQYQSMTGGYGNSLATGAAAKAYYDYMGQLNNQWQTNDPNAGKSGGGGGGGGSKPIEKFENVIPPDSMPKEPPKAADEGNPTDGTPQTTVIGPQAMPRLRGHMPQEIGIVRPTAGGTMRRSNVWQNELRD